jgi:hypothetical protein
MNCPACTTSIELTWSRYLRSISGRHTCPVCATVFRFKLTKAYLLLWLDIIALALITAATVRTILPELFGYAPDDLRVLALSVAIPVFVWGTVFLASNRRALGRLATRRVRGRAHRPAP